jgi:tRNA(Ile)-lysidine synthase
LTIAQDQARLLLDLAGLQRLSEGDLRGVLRMALRSLGADLRAIGATQIMTLATQIMATSAGSGAHPLSSGLAWSVVTLDRHRCLALHHQDELPVAPDGPWLDANWRRQVARAVLPLGGEYAIGAWRLTSQVFDRHALPAGWQRNPNRWAAFCDAAAVHAPVLTTPQPGDRIAPLGLAGRHKLVGDLFTDAKIAPALRAGWPVIVDDASGVLLWVCGLAQAQATRITAQTRRVLALTWQHAPASV